MGKGEFIGGGLSPESGKDDDAGVGEHPEDVAPTRRTGRGRKSGEIAEVSKNRSREGEGQGEANGTKPGGDAD